MRERCEVCENFRPEQAAQPRERLVELTLDVRPVLLCRGHARIAESSGVRSFEALRELYGSGRRSFVPRRRPIRRKRRDDQRAGRGRRATDAAR
jgi:hypothetical protein